MIIIWLPPTGILLISFLFPIKKKLVFGYSLFFFGLSFLMVIWIIFRQDFVTQTVCSVIFARFTNPKMIYILYSILYQFGLFSMLFLSVLGVMKSKDLLQKKLLRQILFGVMSFIFPALLTVIAVPATRGALPSIMCHFALFLAIFISRLIYLENKFTHEIHEKTRKKKL